MEEEEAVVVDRLGRCSLSYGKKMGGDRELRLGGEGEVGLGGQSKWGRHGTFTGYSMVGTGMIWGGEEGRDETRTGESGE